MARPDRRCLTVLADFGKIFYRERAKNKMVAKHSQCAPCQSSYRSITMPRSVHVGALHASQGAPQDDLFSAHRPPGPTRLVLELTGGCSSQEQLAKIHRRVTPPGVATQRCITPPSSPLRSKPQTTPCVNGLRPESSGLHSDISISTNTGFRMHLFSAYSNFRLRDYSNITLS